MTKKLTITIVAAFVLAALTLQAFDYPLSAIGPESVWGQNFKTNEAAGTARTALGLGTAATSAIGDFQPYSSVLLDWSGIGTNAAAVNATNAAAGATNNTDILRATRALSELYGSQVVARSNLNAYSTNDNARFNQLASMQSAVGAANTNLGAASGIVTRWWNNLSNSVDIGFGSHLEGVVANSSLTLIIVVYRDKIISFNGAFTPIATNAAPYSGISPTIDHMGSAALVNGVLTVVGETCDTGHCEGASNAMVLTFSTNTLARLSATAIGSEGSGIAFVPQEGPNGVLYISSQPTNVVQKYDAVTLASLGSITFDWTVPGLLTNIQGITFNPNYNEFYAVVDSGSAQLGPAIYTFDNTGHTYRNTWLDNAAVGHAQFGSGLPEGSFYEPTARQLLIPFEIDSGAKQIFFLKMQTNVLETVMQDGTRTNNGNTILNGTLYVTSSASISPTNTSPSDYALYLAAPHNSRHIEKMENKDIGLNASFNFDATGTPTSAELWQFGVNLQRNGGGVDTRNSSAIDGFALRYDSSASSGASTFTLMYQPFSGSVTRGMQWKADGSVTVPGSFIPEGVLPSSVVGTASGTNLTALTLAGGLSLSGSTLSDANTTNAGNISFLDAQNNFTKSNRFIGSVLVGTNLAVSNNIILMANKKLYLSGGVGSVQGIDTYFQSGASGDTLNIFVNANNSAQFDASGNVTFNAVTGSSFTGSGANLTSIPESGVTSLVADLASKANTNSPVIQDLNVTNSATSTTSLSVNSKASSTVPVLMIKTNNNNAVWVDQNGKVAATNGLSLSGPLAFTGTTPTVTTNGGNGTGGSVTAIGSSVAGLMTLIVGTTPVASTSIVTIVFSDPLNTSTNLFLQAQSTFADSTRPLHVAARLYPVWSNATTCVIMQGSTALQSGQTYYINWFRPGY